MSSCTKQGSRDSKCNLKKSNACSYDCQQILERPSLPLTVQDEEDSVVKLEQVPKPSSTLLLRQLSRAGIAQSLHFSAVTVQLYNIPICAFDCMESKAKCASASPAA